MEILFYDFKQQYNSSVTNYMNFAPTVKILLHKYFYSNNNYLLNIISCIRDECEVIDVIYNQNARTFVLKIPKGKMTKVQKEIQKMNSGENNNWTTYTINDYFYSAIAMAFHDFFLNIKEDFEKTLTIIPDLETDDLPLLKQAFNTLIQCPTLVSNIIQITSITESDNCIVINI